MRSVYITGVLAVSLFIFGITVTIYGPTLLQLSYFYNVTITEMSFVFTFSAIGAVLGSILNSLLLDRLKISYEIQGSICFIFCGISLSVMQWVPSVYSFHFLSFLTFLFKVYSNAKDFTYATKLWMNHTFRNSAVHLMMIFATLGNSVGPLVTKPFLLDSVATKMRGLPLCFQCNNTDNDSTSLNVSNSLENKIFTIFAPYTINGMLCFGLLLFYLPVFWCKFFTRSDTLNYEEMDGEYKIKSSDSSTNRKYTILIYSLLMFFLIFAIGIQYIMPGLLSTFVALYLKWPIEAGATLTTAYTASVVTGRIAIMIASYRRIQQTTMIIFGLFLSTLGYVVLSFSLVRNEIFFTVLMLAVGLGASPLSACPVMWIANYIEGHDYIGAMIMCAAGISQMTMPPFAAYLFQTLSEMWLFHLCLICSCLNVFLFILMSFVLRWRNFHSK